MALGYADLRMRPINIKSQPIQDISVLVSLPRNQSRAEAVRLKPCVLASGGLKLSPCWLPR